MPDSSISSQDNSNCEGKPTSNNNQKKRERKKIKEAVFSVRPAAERAHRNEQYSRRSNAKLLYIPEAVSSFELAEESERKALQVFHDRLDLKHTKPEHIEAAPRIGERNADNTSPVLVNFLSRKTVQQVIHRQKLKTLSQKL